MHPSLMLLRVPSHHPQRLFKRAQMEENQTRRPSLSPSIASSSIHSPLSLSLLTKADSFHFLVIAGRGRESMDSSRATGRVRGRDELEVRKLVSSISFLLPPPSFKRVEALITSLLFSVVKGPRDRSVSAVPPPIPTPGGPPVRPKIKLFTSSRVRLLLLPARLSPLSLTHTSCSRFLFHSAPPHHSPSFLSPPSPPTSTSVSPPERALSFLLVLPSQLLPSQDR